MAIIRYQHRTDTTKEGRKKTAPAPSSGGGGGGGQTPFQKLAVERGVDLPAEQERARQQMAAGQPIGGTAAQWQISRDIADFYAGKGTKSSFDLLDEVRAGFASGVLTSPNQPPDRITPSLSQAPGYTGPQPFGREMDISLTWAEKRTDALKRMEELSKKMGIEPPSPFAALAIVVPSGAWGPLFSKGSMLGKGMTTSGIIGGKTVAKGVALNTKTLKVALKFLAKYVFSKKALLWYGVWASSVTIGLWGAAEAPESITFPQYKYQIADARRTGNWSSVDEAEEAKAEILDFKKWEKVALWSPISAYVGISKKLKGAYSGAAVVSKIIEDSKKQQETGQTEEDFWKERDKEKQEQFEANEKAKSRRFREDTDYMNEANAAAKAAGREEDRKAYEEAGRFWANERDKERAKEAADRIAIAEFWLAYRKIIREMYENNRPSNLNFGLL